jgi:LemA protein
MGGLIIGIIVVVLIIAVIGWWISKRNHFVVLQNKVEESFSTIDVYLKKRYD